jgi:hypothetical protein
MRAAGCYGRHMTISSSTSRRAGIVLASCAALAVVAIAFHPFVTVRGTAPALAQIREFALVDRLVHGSLIVVSVGLFFGLVVFAVQRGLQRELVLTGLIAYVIGLIAVIGAALIDGFIVPAVASRFGTASKELASAAALLAFSASAIQVLTKFGLAAISAAILFWSLDLARDRGMPRISGIIGIVAALIVPAIITTGGALSAHAVGAILLVQAAWYIAIAVLLITRES